MRRSLCLFALLVGCGGSQDPTVSGRSWFAEDFVPPSGSLLEFVPPGWGDATPMWLDVKPNRWVMYTGFDLETAPETDRISVSGDGAFKVVGKEVLPKKFKQGDLGQISEVLSVESREAWYGTFPVVVTVQVNKGPLEGELAMAQGIGPIYLTLGMNQWELASYLLPAEEM